MLDVFATRVVLFMIVSVFPLTSMVSWLIMNSWNEYTISAKGIYGELSEKCLTSGKSLSTSDISLPLSPQPTYTMISLLENLDKAWEMTVFPQPKAPGIAVVPPWTHLWKKTCTSIGTHNLSIGLQGQTLSSVYWKIGLLRWKSSTKAGSQPVWSFTHLRLIVH